MEEAGVTRVECAGVGRVLPAADAAAMAEAAWGRNGPAVLGCRGIVS